MSIPVPVEGLAEAMAERPYAYLLTVSDDGRPHAVAVTPVFVNGVLRATVGRRTASNASARPNGVSLVWPPAEAGGYSLIADGAASASGEVVEVRPTKAVLHRPAPADAGSPEAGSCGSDCVGVRLD
ncbi:MAG: pyridoxamine 5'-phosphate oxidase family protein [Actinobacteria bacterium]|uniref:Unannotated protein n=1 Tax=freshwater metagenome TaxID=449393 RepID=A0A6J6TS95_9ZZZZ|nr:pyridoxamine 5'-phosphate oxidase family protein [Actinomycetota bacterium]MSY12619.1 pyridoxamine 5'-phosphate oxidase family protein [Actinomycetota bacterium]MSZ03717.1 pyridoxamine 5'-phosphate oxidase family protein [Actinomycetota bacterium]MTB07227.1 pyridoxamine 5'-phosphate oxidase family protein [Actinomycetota bacterium]